VTVFYSLVCLRAAVGNSMSVRCKNSYGIRVIRAFSVLYYIELGDDGGIEEQIMVKKCEK
jgi:hypothetical protein